MECVQGLSLVTKIIAKESVLPWQVAGGWLLEAELLLSVRHAHICRSAGHVTTIPASDWSATAGAWPCSRTLTTTSS